MVEQMKQLEVATENAMAAAREAAEAAKHRSDAFKSSGSCAEQSPENVETELRQTLTLTAENLKQHSKIERSKSPTLPGSAAAAHQQQRQPREQNNG